MCPCLPSCTPAFSACHESTRAQTVGCCCVLPSRRQRPRQRGFDVLIFCGAPILLAVRTRGGRGESRCGCLLISGRHGSVRPPPQPRPACLPKPNRLKNKESRRMKIPVSPPLVRLGLSHSFVLAVLLCVFLGQQGIGLSEHRRE